MDEAEAKQRVKDHRWSITEDSGRGWRRVVPSPAPVEIVEIDTVKCLLAQGIVVITVGGGGIPVIDKDLAASLLATLVDAELFLIATSVDHVSLNYGTAKEERLTDVPLAKLKTYTAKGSHFAGGSMAPKIEAIIRYLENGGRRAIVTSPNSVSQALKGNAGSRFYP